MLRFEKGGGVPPLLRSEKSTRRRRRRGVPPLLRPEGAAPAGRGAQAAGLRGGRRRGLPPLLRPEGAAPAGRGAQAAWPRGGGGRSAPVFAPVGRGAQEADARQALRCDAFAHIALCEHCIVLPCSCSFAPALRLYAQHCARKSTISRCPCAMMPRILCADMPSRFRNAFPVSISASW